MKQRTEITFETKETIRLSHSRPWTSRFCNACGDLTDMATPRAIAVLADVGERAIFRLIEEGMVHFIDDGGIYVCLHSLADNKVEVKK